MDTKKAIVAFSQSEKIKAGLIWATQAVEILSGLEGDQKHGAEKMVRMWFSSIASEMGLARRMADDDSWTEAEKAMSTALVMLNSGVAQESTYHLTQVLMQVTNVGQRSMTLLREQGLL